MLALARTGSTAEAARQFAALRLSEIDSEDTASLAARLQKDVALAAEGEERRRLAALASTSYSTIAARTGGYYPAINAATMALVAGERQGAVELARTALQLVSMADASSYYPAATEAEACLLLGEVAAARSALQRAAGAHGGDYGAMASTRRQLRLVCSLLGLDDELLTELAGPIVAHYCGHRMAAATERGRFAAEQETGAATCIAEVLDRNPVGVAYGSLASGGDILWAEALLARDAELHVVLPFCEQDFLGVSVAPAGLAWVRRFRSCLAAASSVTYVTDDAFLGDESLFAYCAGTAMGLALLRARFLDAEARQLALWDGEPAAEEVGTAADVERWRATGRPARVVRPDGSSADSTATVGLAAKRPRDAGAVQRVVRAMLIGDIRGYSALSDTQLLVFHSCILGTVAEVFSTHDAELEFVNTWGDAVFAVLGTAGAAARCALELQERFALIDLEAAGLPAQLALRLSGHVGPVFPIVDPVLGRPAFIGSHVSRTARIEPVTPPGAVYVTEAFAADLELCGVSDVRCDYVGHLPTAKNYGKLRMYRIRRPTTRQPAATS